MTATLLNALNEARDRQLKRQEYPEGFPPLPEIPANRYVDEGFANLEKDALWSTTWLFAGLETDLPQMGSYFLFEELGRSVIVVRGRDGQVRAFQNACRHRGAALLKEASGKIARFLCPYHAWGYDLDGKLRSVPDAHDFACLDKNKRGLGAVACETWRGLIFLKFEKAGQPLSDFLAPLERFVSALRTEQLVTIDRSIFEAKCNWKLAYHNFTESYHVNMVHPKTLRSLLDLQSRVVRTLKNGHSHIALHKIPGKSQDNDVPGLPPGIDVAFLEYAVSLAIFPNAFFFLDPGGMALLNFWPDGTYSSRLEARLLSWEPRSKNEKYWDAVCKFSNQIIDEDLKVFGGVQRSMVSGAVSRILTNYQERTIYWFEEEIDRRIGLERVPQESRVEQLLRAYVE